MSYLFEISFLLSVLRMAVPLIFAALGGFLSERCGVIDISLEGKMLMGAFVAASTAHFTQSAIWGGFAAVVFGVFVGICYAFLCVTLKGHQVIVGTAVNLFASGITPFLANILFETTSSTPVLSGDAKFHMLPFFAVIVIGALILYCSRFTLLGLWHRVAGDLPPALEASGVSSAKVRFFALGIAGALVCFGGATLSLFLSSGFSRGMTAGRGFMALAAVVLGKWKPHGAILGCLLFGFAEALQIQMQSSLGGADSKTTTFSVPVQLIETFPYLLTLIILAGFVGNAKAPKYLGRV